MQDHERVILGAPITGVSRLPFSWLAGCFCLGLVVILNIIEVVLVIGVIL